MFSLPACIVDLRLNCLDSRRDDHKILTNADRLSHPEKVRICKQKYYFLSNQEKHILKSSVNLLTLFDAKTFKTLFMT